MTKTNIPQVPDKGKNLPQSGACEVIPRPATDKPICLDLYCGAGGAAMGYARAGFYVIGIDRKPQPNFPFEFYQADALVVEILDWVDFIHASPECQHFTVSRNIGNMDMSKYSNDIKPIREKLQATGKPYVIENVPGSPLINPILLHGDMFGLKVIRKRLFESNLFILTPPQPIGERFTNAGNSYSSFANGAKKISVAGHNFSFRDAQLAMGIDWMKKRKEIALAIPPAYTEFLGRQILEQIAQCQAV